MTHIPQPLDPISSIKNALPQAVQDVVLFRNEITLVVDPQQIVAVMRYLRDTAGLVYNYLSDISAVDYYEADGSHETKRPARFGVCYHLYSMLYSRRIRVKVYLEEENPVVPTVVNVWPAANWLEREIYDMMGITFEGHPDMRRLLMPEDWLGHPHRRDYPLGYETPMFSFNVEEIIRHKPFAKN